MNDFNVPYYILEEIIQYIEERVKGKEKCMKWKNIKALIKLAVANKRLTKEHADFLEDRLKNLEI